MPLTEKDIDNFIALYKKTYNKTIDREQAYREMGDLVSLVEMTFKPMTKSEHKKYYNGLPGK